MRAEYVVTEKGRKRGKNGLKKREKKSKVGKKGNGGGGERVRKRVNTGGI